MHNLKQCWVSLVYFEEVDRWVGAGGRRGGGGGSIAEERGGPASRAPAAATSLSSLTD